jgi:hypothetical protein
MNNKFHEIENLHTDEKYLYLTVDHQSYRIRWADCSRRLLRATKEQRETMVVAPSGYGLHWPLVDEDLAITPLLKKAELFEMETV